MEDRRRLLELALKGLEAERDKLSEEIAQVKTLLNETGVSRGRAVTAFAPETSRKPRTMSAAARKRISEGMKRRYATLRASTETPSPKKQGPAVVLTSAGRKKLSDMMKARWAAKKKAAKRSAA